MKLRSVITLIIAAVLMCGGIAVCFTAKGMAGSEGISLYSNDSDSEGNRVFSSVYGADDETAIEKLVLVLSNADVNIIMTDEKDLPDGTVRLEFVNFTEGSFSLGMINKVLTVNNTINILGMLEEGNFALNFDGLRYYVHGIDSFFRTKTVNVYVKGENALNAIYITAESGNIGLRSVRTSGDIKITLGQGSISSESSAIGSYLIIDAQDATVLLSGGEAAHITADIAAGSAELDSVDFDAANITAGSAKVYVSGSYSAYSCTAESESGKITADGAAVSSPWSFGSEGMQHIINIKTESGNINFSSTAG